MPGTGSRDAAFSVFPTCSLPLSLICTSLASPPSPRQGLSQGPSSGQPPPLLAPDWRGPRGPTPRPLPLRWPERASPGQGWAGGGDAQGARKRGCWAWRGEEYPRLPPGFSELKTQRERVPSFPPTTPPHSEARHPPPAPEQSRRPAGPVPNRAASRPCAGHRVRCCASGIRRALALPVSPPPPPSPVAPRSRCSGCSLLPLPRKLTEQQRGGGARSPASQLIRPSPLGTRERPLAEPPGSCARSAGRGPRPRRPQVRRPRLPRFPECLPGRRPPEPREQ